MTTITDPDALPTAEVHHPAGEPPTVSHWKAGSPFAGDSDRFSDVFDPATGQVTRRLRLASRADADAVIGAAAAGVARLAGHVPRAAHAGPVPVP